MLLKNKVVIVTGASKGLGAAISRLCAKAGARIILAARSMDQLKDLQKTIEAEGNVALPIQCDVSKLSDLQQLVDRTVQAFGRIDGLVNNAGVNFVKSFLDTDEREWDHIMDVDLKGSFFLSQYCARQMVKQAPKGGSIVQIASVHTIASLSGAGPYDAAKRGVIGYSKAAAVELAKEKVRVNVLSPGLCSTNIWKDIVAAAPSEEECIKFWNSNIPAERLIEPDEIAQACIFLLSDMSSAITGANLLADAGMTSQLISKESYTTTDIEGK